MQNFKFCTISGLKLCGCEGVYCIIVDIFNVHTCFKPSTVAFSSSSSIPMYNGCCLRANLIRFSVFFVRVALNSNVCLVSRQQNSKYHNESHCIKTVHIYKMNKRNTYISIIILSPPPHLKSDEKKNYFWLHCFNIN